MSKAKRNNHWWEIPGNRWLPGGAFASLTMKREFDALTRLTRNPMLDMILTIQKDQQHWLKALNDAVSPFNQIAKVLPDYSQGLLANLQREMRLATEVTRENSLSHSISTVLGEQQRWKSLHLGLGAAQWVDTLAKAQKQWGQLAGIAGLTHRIREETFAPLIALQRSMAAAGIQSEAMGGAEEEAASEESLLPSPGEIQQRLDTTLEKQLAPAWAELKGLMAEAASPRTKRSKPEGLRPVHLFWILFQILAGLATFDGWYQTKYGKQGNPQGLTLTPEKTQQLRESMEFVIAFSHQIMGCERIVLRKVPLRKTPRGPRLLPVITPGQTVQVLEERHEWIAIGFEVEGEWISGWVLKKYTQRSNHRDARGFPLLPKALK